MKSMKKNLVCALLISAFLGGTVSAHDWFATVGDVKDYKSGDTVPVYVYTTHSLIVGDIIPARSDNTFFVLQNNKALDMKVSAKPNEALKTLEASFQLPKGAPTMVVLSRSPRFSAVTTSGTRSTATKATMKALGFTVGQSSFNQAWCKVYINPASNDTSFAKPLGLPLEIVPQSNPADIVTNTAAVFTVLFNGKPLRNAKVNATYKDFNPNEEDGWAVKDLKTDSSGKVTFDIPKSGTGIWIVKATHNEPVSKNPNYDAESLASWVSFVVKK